MDLDFALSVLAAFLSVFLGFNCYIYYIFLIADIHNFFSFLHDGANGPNKNEAVAGG